MDSWIIILDRFHQLHRLTACKLLGLDRIKCIITCEDAEHARLAEIDENLIRSELDTLERAELWLERDQILEQMGQGLDQGKINIPRKVVIDFTTAKTTLELAKEVGYNERTFQQASRLLEVLSQKWNR